MSTRLIRGRVRGGRVEPIEEVELHEGEEVSLVITEPTPPPGTKETVLAVLRRSPPLTAEESAELRASIAAGRVPARTEGIFDRERK